MKLYDQCLAMAVGVCFGALQTALAQPPAYDTHATQLDHPR